MTKKNRSKAGLFDMIKVEPRTANQERLLLAAEEDKHLLITGCAGTGKTFLSCYSALKRVLAEESDRVIIARTIVPSRDIGFMPGTIDEKQAPYETPYIDIFNQLLGRGDGYEILKKNGKLVFETSSFLRGVTLRNAEVVVDEAQNWTFRELDTIITRAGEGTRYFFCGDDYQTDFTDSRDMKGFRDFTSIINNMGEFASVEMTENDIVRSGLVRSYIIAKNKGGKKAIQSKE